LPPDRAGAEALARRLGLSVIAAQMLLNRGVTEESDARAFLHPDLNHLRDPSCMPEILLAAERVREAVERGRKIAIYGDYDVDGISATAILLRCLALLGAQPVYHIPDRLEEGYGLNAAAVRTLAGEGVKLLITVDCGITAAKEVALARELGVEVIVTDHHEPGEVVPADAILINPKLPGCIYPFRELSGAGIAFKLAWAVGKSFSAGRKVSAEFREFLLDSISLAALGTIADVVPLRDENRTIACFGVRGLSQSSAAGIKALRQAAGVEEGLLSAWDVAFKLAPRLNAAGRLGSARQAVELLTTNSAERAAEIAAHLNRENARRQKMQERILTESREMIAREGGVEGRSSIVLASEDWHAGVIGVVAARLAEAYWRPTALVRSRGKSATAPPAPSRRCTSSNACASAPEGSSATAAMRARPASGCAKTRSSASGRSSTRPPLGAWSSATWRLSWRRTRRCASPTSRGRSWTNSNGSRRSAKATPSRSSRRSAWRRRPARRTSGTGATWRSGSTRAECGSGPWRSTGARWLRRFPPGGPARSSSRRS